MYTNVMAEQLIRQRQREMNEFIRDSQLEKEARSYRASQVRTNGFFQWLKQFTAFNFRKSQPAARADCV